MDDIGIKVRKNDRDDQLGPRHVDGPPTVALWGGLRMVRYRMPDEMLDRHVVAPNSVISWLCRGRMSARLRYGLGEVRTMYRTDDLMLYSGGREIALAHWQAHDAEMVSIEIDPARLRLLEGGDPRFGETPLTGSPQFSDPGLRTLVGELWGEIAAGCPRGALYADSLSLGLALHVHRRFGAAPDAAGDDAREARSRLSSPVLQRVDDYIRQHLAEPIGLTDLAREAGLSRYHFTRLFTNTVGRSPYQHVLHKRLERAYHLLTGSQVPLADVALAAGFSSQSHFATVCRRVLGATPRELRARH